MLEIIGRTETSRGEAIKNKEAFGKKAVTRRHVFKDEEFKKTRRMSNGDTCRFKKSGILCVFNKPLNMTCSWRSRKYQPV